MANDMRKKKEAPNTCAIEGSKPPHQRKSKPLVHPPSHGIPDALWTNCLMCPYPCSNFACSQTPNLTVD